MIQFIIGLVIGIFIGAFIAVYTVGHITIKVHFPFGAVKLPIGSLDPDAVNTANLYDDEIDDLDEFDSESDIDDKDDTNLQ